MSITSSSPSSPSARTKVTDVSSLFSSVIELECEIWMEKSIPPSAPTATPKTAPFASMSPISVENSISLSQPDTIAPKTLAPNAIGSTGPPIAKAA